MNLKLALDFRDLLTDKRRGHMGCYHYSTPQFQHDPVNGAELWAQLVANPTTYSIIDDEIALLNQQSEMLAKVTGRIARFVDLGAGSLKAVKEKTLPLLSHLRPAHYTAYDFCSRFATDAANLIAVEMPETRTLGYAGNFLEEDLLDAAGEMRFMGGISFFNLPDDNGQQPYKRMAQQLRHLVSGCDYLLITADTNQDLDKLVEIYSDPAHKAFSENFAYTLARDSGVIGLELDAFEYQPMWYADRSLLAHTLVATKVQNIELMGKQYTIECGAALHVDNSYKLTGQDFTFICDLAGVELVESFGDGAMKTFLVRNAAGEQRIAA